MSKANDEFGALSTYYGEFEDFVIGLDDELFTDRMDSTDFLKPLKFEAKILSLDELHVGVSDDDGLDFFSEEGPLRKWKKKKLKAAIVSFMSTN